MGRGSPSTKDPLKELVNEEVDPDDAEALAALRPYRRPKPGGLGRSTVPAIAQMEMPKDPETCRQICLDTVDLACGCDHRGSTRSIQTPALLGGRVRG